MKKILLGIASGFLLLTSCSKDSLSNGGEMLHEPVGKLSVNLSAEINPTFSISGGDSRALIGHDASASIKVKLPFKDLDKAPKEGGVSLALTEGRGSTIYLLTAIASNQHYGSAVLPWTFIPDDSGKGHLELRRGVIPLYSRTPVAIDESTYTPSSSEQFYITAIFGSGNVLNANTQLGASLEVDPVVMGLTQLQVGIAGAQDMAVPFACDWTPLTITSDTGGAVGSSTTLEFRPQGSLIAFELGNTATVGLDPTPDAIYVNSQRFGNQGSFNLKDVPSGTDKSPLFTHNTCSFSMKFDIATASQATLSAGQDAKTMTGSSGRRLFYTWVMRNSAASTTDKTVIMVHGTATHPDKPYSEVWTTSFAGATSPVDHTAHRVPVNLTGRGVEIPVADITNYMVAGGLPSSTNGSGVSKISYLQSPTNNNGKFSEAKWPGFYGDLRLVESESPYDIGMYNAYVVNGKADSKYNPDSISMEEQQVYLAADASKSPFKLSDKFFIPTGQDWAGVVPSLSGNYPIGATGTSITWGMSGTRTNAVDIVRFDRASGNPFVAKTTGDYIATINSNGDRIVYGVRFKEVTPQIGTTVCPNASYGISFCTAFRYTYCTGTSYRNTSKNGGLKIDVVYLGNEGVSMTPNLLSSLDEAFWTEAGNGRASATRSTYPGTFVKSVFLPSLGDQGIDTNVSDPFTQVAASDTKGVFQYGHYWTSGWTGTWPAQTDWWGYNGSSVNGGGELKLSSSNQPHSQQPVLLFRKR